MLSQTISNYTIHHIKSSNIIKWLTVIQTKRERERKKKRIRVRENEDTRKEKKRKTKIYQEYVHGGDAKIKKWKNKEKHKNL